MFTSIQRDKLPHVLYEIDMLNNTKSLISNDCNNNQTIYNAIVESFLLHVRCLSEFFNNRSFHQGDDLNIGFYTPDINRYRIFKRGDPLEIEYKNLCKTLVHLSTTRTMNHKQYINNDLVKAVSNKCKEFIEFIYHSEAITEDVKEKYIHQLSNSLLDTEIQYLSTTSI